MKQSKYKTISDEQQAEMGKYAVENNNFAVLCSKKIHVRATKPHFYKRHYLDELHFSNGTAVTSTASRKNNRPHTLGDINENHEKGRH